MSLFTNVDPKTTPADSGDSREEGEIDPQEYDQQAREERARAAAEEEARVVVAVADEAEESRSREVLPVPVTVEFESGGPSTTMPGNPEIRPSHNPTRDPSQPLEINRAASGSRLEGQVPSVPAPVENTSSRSSVNPELGDSNVGRVNVENGGGSGSQTSQQLSPPNVVLSRSSLNVIAKLEEDYRQAKPALEQAVAEQDARIEATMEQIRASFAPKDAVVTPSEK